ncbi:hypothetical protein LJC58_09430, partial [Lachnospiraceae bacterium OttesenSCG-928-D06]|nr:hypothetical protein [Lachnospiraceae bacterium OttesenSCG-928-D06]
LIQKEKLKLEQLKHRKRLIDAQEKKKMRDTDKRRKFIVGELFLEFYPEYKKLQPQINNAADNVEFEPLIRFLSALANNKDVVEKLQSEISHS